MRVGVPKEIKVHEYRVGLTPASVAELVAAGHEVFVEAGAGKGIDCPDNAYRKAGAEILPDAPSVFKAADMIVKVKEPQAQEIALLEPRHILFTYLHLAADKDQALGLMKSGATCIAYETAPYQLFPADRMPLGLSALPILFLQSWAPVSRFGER